MKLRTIYWVLCSLTKLKIKNSYLVKLLLYLNLKVRGNYVIIPWTYSCYTDKGLLFKYIHITKRILSILTTSYPSKTSFVFLASAKHGTPVNVVISSRVWRSSLVRLRITWGAGSIGCIFTTLLWVTSLWCWSRKFKVIRGTLLLEWRCGTQF